MTTDIITTAPGALAAQAPEWQSKIDLVKRLVAKGCSNDEFELLCYVAQKHELDPLAGDVWMIPFQGGACKPTVGFHGLIRIAHRTGQFDGIDKGTETIDGELFHWAIVYRKDCSHPFKARIRASEYNNGRNPLWKAKPWTMGEKVAASHALRLAFSLDGLYIPEEVDGPREIREVADTSRPAPRQVTMSAEAPTGPVDRCEVCGRDTGAFPALRVRNRDGRNICDGCQRKAEKEMHVPSPAAAPASASPKVIPTTIVPPKNGVPAPEIGAKFVCAECGKEVTGSEEKASRLLLSKVLCKGCMQKWTKEEAEA